MQFTELKGMLKIELGIGRVKLTKVKEIWPVEVMVNVVACLKQ